MQVPACVWGQIKVVLPLPSCLVVDITRLFLPVLPRPLTEDVSGVQRQRDAINVVSDPRVEHRVQVPPWMLLQNQQVGDRYSNLGLQ